MRPERTVLPIGTEGPLFGGLEFGTLLPGNQFGTPFGGYSAGLIPPMVSASEAISTLNTGGTPADLESTSAIRQETIRNGPGPYR